MAARTGEVADAKTTTGFVEIKFKKFMNQALQEKIESEQYRKDDAKFAVGDSVKVHTKVVEGDKERIQIFAGVVMGRRGHGLNETFIVRRISYGEGVERVFPLHSPRVDKIEVERTGSAGLASSAGLAAAGSGAAAGASSGAASSAAPRLPSRSFTSVAPLPRRLRR